MKLRKPPILEAFIRFDFALPDNAPPMDQKRADEFLALFEDQVSPKDIQLQQNVRIEWNKAGNPKRLNVQRTLESARATNADESRWLQVGQRHIVYNVLRLNATQTYPGYSDLKTAAFDCLDRYTEYFKPSSILIATLHYVDIIEIPKKPGWKLTDYMRLYPQRPETGFGPLKQFMLVLDMACSDPVDGITISMSREPDDPERNVFRLRLEWDAHSENVNSLEKAEVEARLDRLHKQVQACFRSCFTDDGWQLFEPEEEGQPT